MQPVEGNAANRRVPVRAVITRALLGLAINVVLLAFFCAVAWQSLSPYQGEIRHILAPVRPAYVTLFSLCAVFGYIACHIPSVGAAISTGLCDFLESRFRRTSQR
ncbi:hypothetical protein R75465_07833 [Paraburkholderia aspalathi]|uniref:hypothetical protein n=1 Tax=Paraburkholderia aspalathi TaxID=1324617 RepID=UPI001B15FE26|nr:hypothetical protein [Paraburkholderia aspalathi]CAE6864015.1 hypothetical protein R75465_07833 [Paraburkholderia aspalathi]